MDMTALMEAEIRAALAEAKCEALEADLLATQEKVKFLESGMQVVQLKLMEQTTRAEDAAQERDRTHALFEEAIKTRDPQVVEVKTETPEWTFQVQRDGANNMIGVIAKPRTE